MALSALDEYRTRQAKWTAEHRLAQRAFIAIGNWRLGIAIAAVALAWFAFAEKSISGWLLLVPLVAFIALVIWHQHFLGRRTCAERAIRFYDQGISRLNDEWSGNGNQGLQFQDLNHLYGDDLDLFGRGSLFELLSTARTAAGERALANWLLAPASFAVAAERQDSVRELAGKLALREDIALLGEDIRSPVDAETIARWGGGSPVLFPNWLRPASLCLAFLGLAALVLRLANVWPIWPLLAVLGTNAAIMFGFRKQTAQVHGGIEGAAHQLGLLALLVGRLEHEQFVSAGLMRLRAALIPEGMAASRRIKHLDRWLELLDSSDHVVLRVLEPVVLYKMQLVMAVERWRARNGVAVGRWIEALAEFEALSSLGALHYERSDWAFPQLNGTGAAHFHASNLGHPLLPSKVGVRNSLKLDGECRLLIVSGSNMSGKSTLLRSVGLNAVLAWAGAPVSATELQISPLQVGASLRTSDSLQDNRSRFFSEISRLRQVVDLTKGPVPVLFLLDELLSGTNSHDRRIGAAGIVRGLLRGNTIGLITTHDLALAQLDEDMNAPMKNVHFEDRITDGKIEFDYQLRPGVVTHSNALELMRSIGLEI